MRQCCGCCISLQKGVVVIGVISMLCGVVLSVGYSAVAVTLEEHREACKEGRDNDLLGVLPACAVLADTATLLAARIFVYVQVGVWSLFFIFSILLIIGAVKERSGLLVPWVVLAVLVVGAVVWAGVNAALQSRTLDLLACVLAVATLAYCCLVVRSYARHLKRQALVSVLVPSTYSPSCIEPTYSPSCIEPAYSRVDPTYATPHINPTYTTSHPCCQDRHTGKLRELPPAYTLHPPSLKKTSSPKKKCPLPTGLGVKT